MKAERKFIKKGKCRNAVAFQVFLTPRNFLYAEYLTARFSWGSNILLGEQNSSSENLTKRQYYFGFLPCLLLPKLHIILQELVGGAIKSNTLLIILHYKEKCNSFAKIFTYIFPVVRISFSHLLFDEFISFVDSHC